MFKLNDATLVDIIGALVADELTQLRPNDAQLWKARSWSAETTISHSAQPSNAPNEIHVDSFEWIAIATRVVEFFRLDVTGVEDYLLRAPSLGEWAEVVATSREMGSRDIQFSSSGSTGTPSKHTHRWDSLVSEAEFFANYFRTKQDVNRIVSVVSPHHIYGFIFSVLLPLAIKAEVIRGIKAFALVANGQTQAGDILIGFPDWYEQLATRNTAFSNATMAVCSSGPAAQETLSAIEQSGISHLLEVYGSSETAGVGFRGERYGHYQLLPYWHRVDDTTIANATHQMSLPDRVEWHDAEHFRPVGRHDHAVQIRGYNVYPQKIAEVLTQHPNVKDARVRAHEHRHTELKALVIPTTHAADIPEDVLIAQLQTWLAEQLPAIEIPSHLSIANEVPKNPLGKESDWPINPMRQVAL